VAPAKTHSVSSGPVAVRFALDVEPVVLVLAFAVLPVALVPWLAAFVAPVGVLLALLVLEDVLFESTLPLFVEVLLLLPESPGRVLGFLLLEEMLTVGFLTVTSVLWKWRHRKIAAITRRITKMNESSHLSTRIVSPFPPVV
jgi:hypothetical protein